MKVSILAFGIAKDIMGSNKIQLDIPKSSTTNDLKALLIEHYPEFDSIHSFQLALNADYANGKETIKETDEIVIIPPVSGG